MTLSEYIKQNVGERFAAIPLDRCRIVKERLIADAPTPLFAVMIEVPYPRRERGRVASFACIPDYHVFFASFEEDVRRLLEKKYGDVYAKIFSDHSPIDERRAAAEAGLGVIGDNGLFISEEYGSFVFLGEIILSLSEEELESEGIEVRYGAAGECLHCGLCAAACPAGCIGGDKSSCVSALTQKKGLLSDTERDIIKRGGYAWGCDVCALVCPMNDGKEGKVNDFFKRGAISPKTFADIDAMSDGEYSKYPFSWRKREVIARNFGILEKEPSND